MLVIYSIPGVFLLPIQFKPIYGKIMDKDVSSSFSEMGTDAEVWETTMDQA